MAAGFSDNKSFKDKLFGNLSSQAAPIFSTKPLAKYSTGARVVLRINGQLVGFAYQVSWRINTIHDEIMTIDDYLPYELAPTRISVEGTLGMFHIPGKGATAEFMQAHILSFMTMKYISIEVRDSSTNHLLFYTSKAAVVSRAEDIKSENMGTVQLSWKAIGWQDELTPAQQTGGFTDSQSASGSPATSNGSPLIFDTPPVKIPGGFDPGSLA